MCGECEDGFDGNQTVGCSRMFDRPGVCGDGTICSEHAKCVTRRGYTGFLCEV